MGIFKPESLGIIFLLLLCFPLSPVLYFIICAALSWGFPHSSVGKESAYNAGDPGLIAALLYLWYSMCPLKHMCFKTHVQKGLWGACRWIPAPILIPESPVILAFVSAVSQRNKNIILSSALAGPVQNLSWGSLCAEIRSQASWANFLAVPETWLFPHFRSGVKKLTVSSNNTLL